MKGIIAAGSKLTAISGAFAFKMGGNAFDALVAAFFASYMAEPALTSPAGGGYVNTGQELYDFFVDVPPTRAEEPDFYPVEVDFGDTKQTFHIGCASVAVPGTLAGVLKIHSQFASLPLEVLIKPALKLARGGVHLNKLQASFLKMLEPIFLSTEQSRRIFAPKGKILSSGETYKNEDYAKFLELISKKGQFPFYAGQIADRIDEISKKRGGHIRKEDLLRYKVHVRKPIKVAFKNYTVELNPPPAPSGVLIAHTLSVLENENLSEFGSVRHVLSLIEALKETAEFRKRYVDPCLTDADCMEGTLNILGNTTHISAIDSMGNVASMTTTNGEGSGCIIPETGVMLNNMLGEEDLNPHGFFKWKPYVRLPSMMSPTIVKLETKPVLSLGSAGSNRIRSAVIQVMLNRLVFNMSLKDAVRAPRLHYENGTVFIEPGFDESVYRQIEKKYKLVRFSSLNVFFGGVQAVSPSEGAGDPRRGGFAVRV